MVRIEMIYIYFRRVGAPHVRPYRDPQAEVVTIGWRRVVPDKCETHARFSALRLNIFFKNLPAFGDFFRKT